jgi:preprotein translocase subunit YajC
MGHMHTIAAAAATKSGSSSLFLPIIIVALFGLFYFVMIRPQRNRQRQAVQMQNEVVPGSRVRTTAGMYATVVSVEDADVVLEVAPGVNVRYLRRAIMNVVPADTGDIGDMGAHDGQMNGSGPVTDQTEDETTADEATEDGSAKS